MVAIYFPVLRWKQGEQGALANLSTVVKGQIAPIIEFPADCSCGDRRVTGFCATAVDDWGSGRPFYLDLSTIDYGGATEEDPHPALALLRAAHQQGLIPIPVINLAIDPDLLGAIRQAFTEGCFENAALRITEDEEETAADDALERMEDLGIQNEDVDLIIDLGDISNERHIRGIIRLVRDMVEQFGGAYRLTIVLGGAMPGQLGNIGTDSHVSIARHDWMLWSQLHRIHDLSHLFFGDYTTVAAEFVEFPYRGAPKIKYTLEDEWFVIKGHLPRARDTQRQDQSRAIADAPFFRGAHHSFGERRIRECADDIWGPGNATNWVTNDINQHITFVASQVSAILGAP